MAMNILTTRRSAFWLILAVLVVATGCSGSVVARPTPTPAPTVTPTLASHLGPTAVSGLLAPPPRDCQGVAAPHTMTLPDDFGGGFIGGAVTSGDAPAWQFGLAVPPSPLHLESQGATPYPGTKVLWLIGPNYSEPVTLRGHDLRTGTPMWFLLLDLGSDAANAAPSLALDPAIPNRGSTDNPAGHWNIYGVGIIFTVAGCYDLDVTWPEGHWHTVFAVGR